MHESSTSPPSLYHSPPPGDEGGRESSTSESTPLNTPTVAEEPYPSSKRERDLYFSWHKKQNFQHSNSQVRGAAFESSEPLFEDAGDFELFPESPPTFQRFNMATTFEQRNILADQADALPPRLSSSSPRNQTSTLTSALHAQLQSDGVPQHMPDNGNVQHYMNMPEAGRLSVSGRNDSISNMFGTSNYGSGARPISMKDRNRRESNTGGSFMGNGMSWGGISVGSLRDE